MRLRVGVDRDGESVAFIAYSDPQFVKPRRGVAIGWPSPGPALVEGRHNTWTSTAAVYESHLTGRTVPVPDLSDSEGEIALAIDEVKAGCLEAARPRIERSAAHCARTPAPSLPH